MRLFSTSFYIYVCLLLCAFLPEANAQTNVDATKEQCTLKPILMEDFSSESIAVSQIGPARWTAHTPWGGDFGDAQFANPGRDGPFKIVDNHLAITASKTPEGKWNSGLIAGADASGAGIGTRWGYFEARMKFPPGAGTWPAFWLMPLKPSVDKNGLVEVDAVEYYGNNIRRYQAAVHVWYSGQSGKGGGLTDIFIPEGSAVSGFHDYGVDLSQDKIVFFFDHAVMWEFPTPPELNGPMYPLVDLALGAGWPIDKTPNPSTMLVKYVHVYGRGSGKGCAVGLPKALIPHGED